jgi:hypothetical protein
VVHFLADELTGLSAGGFSFPRVFAGAFDGLLLGHKYCSWLSLAVDGPESESCATAREPLDDRWKMAGSGLLRFRRIDQDRYRAAFWSLL